jgi:hypothetical protein
MRTQCSIVNYRTLSRSFAKYLYSQSSSFIFPIRIEALKNYFLILLQFSAHFLFRWVLLRPTFICFTVAQADCEIISVV